MQGHEGIVSGLSFDGADRLVSSSHDRNSFVWTRQGGSWVPELVVTRLTKAGLAVAWSPTNSGKFAIGSSDATVSLCYYDADRGLWAPRLIRKKHTSSVTAVAWHPSGAVLATVSTDGHCRLFNALVAGRWWAGAEGRGGAVCISLPWGWRVPCCAEVDGPGRPAALQSSRFGDCLLELEIAGGSWGLAVAWSPDGRTLAFSSQRPEVELLPGIDLEEPGSLQRAAEQRQAVAVPGLPLKALSFVSGSVLAGGGFDCAPLVFERQEDGQWHFLRKLQGDRQEGGAARLPERGAGCVRA